MWVTSFYNSILTINKICQSVFSNEKGSSFIVISHFIKFVAKQTQYYIYLKPNLKLQSCGVSVSYPEHKDVLLPKATINVKEKTGTASVNQEQVWIRIMMIVIVKK